MKRRFPILVASHYKRAMVIGTYPYPAPLDNGSLKWKASVVLIKIIGGSAYDEFTGPGEFVASQDVSQLKWTLFGVPFLNDGPMHLSRLHILELGMMVCPYLERVYRLGYWTI
jgi:hypothetical protein